MSDTAVRMVPAVCRNCDGTGKIKSSLTMMEMRCICCNGTGIVMRHLFPRLDQTQEQD